MRNALKERLFIGARNSEWLHHAGDAEGLKVLAEREEQLRSQHAEADAVFSTQVARKRAERKRKAEFKNQIRHIDANNIKLTREVTLQIAYSKIRCTMKCHGYFAGLSDHIKQLISETAKKFGGRYNTRFLTWEFEVPVDKVLPTYRDLNAYIESRLEELTVQQKKGGLATPPFTPIQDKPPKFQNENEREYFEERAAILECNEGWDRTDAERAAFVDILKQRGLTRDTSN